VAVAEDVKLGVLASEALFTSWAPTFGEMLIVDDVDPKWQLMQL